MAPRSPRHIRLSGRCFLKSSPGISSEHLRGGRAPLSAFTDLTPKAVTAGNCSRSVPLPSVLAGSAYYARRFGVDLGGDESASPGTGCSSPALFSTGDVVLDFRDATLGGSGRGRRVDVVGVSTSFLRHGERDRNKLLPLNRLLHDMHRYDGHEIPELQRGQVATGHLCMLCALERELDIPPSRNQLPRSTIAGCNQSHGPRVRLIRVADPPTVELVGKKNLKFSTEDEALQMAHTIAERLWEARLAGVEIALRWVDEHPVSAHFLNPTTRTGPCL